MGRYHEALTRLLLSGAFPWNAHHRAPARPAARASKPAPPRRLAAPAQRRAVSEPVQRTPPPRRAADESVQRKQPPRRAARLRTVSLPRTGSAMTHPGRILARHLSDLGMTASDLARDIDVPVNRVTAIINGQRGVTADTALRLGHWFGVDPEDWLELQLQYELALAREEVGARIDRLPRLVDRVP